MSVKNELLNELFSGIEHKKSSKNIEFRYLLLVIGVIVLIGMITFPKIYIQQQIYFKSREITKLKSEYDILKEEHKIISASVEKIKFKDNILDTMF